MTNTRTDTTTDTATDTATSDHTPKPGVWPGVLYDDMAAARAFLTGVLGFTEALIVPDESGGVVHGELRWPEGGGVMVGSRRPEAHGGTGALERAPQWIYVVTADPDAVYERARAAGATVEQEPHDTDYGSRNVAIADPEGTVWVFGTYPGA
ncbi:putative glyoxalase superfamily protein PhnB [Prauserella isguenensis]|uniref:Putative glyoxalase superfamily protein PhnB n=1 Tax=Prauserella isguenensis TaxID=1470180 RepID=A0A839S507_9PSEU|nr:VOC family protein [Prauserella isguenensis]MBB3052100.1 putative glyoxalase superfamily protein PhnB [Prauserella isguenensis]